jgi:hypothetical protein
MTLTLRHKYDLMTSWLKYDFKRIKKSYFDITDKHIKRIIHNKKGEKKR